MIDPRPVALTLVAETKRTKKSGKPPKIVRCTQTSEAFTVEQWAAAISWRTGCGLRSAYESIRLASTTGKPYCGLNFEVVA